MKTSKLFGSALLAISLCFSACEEIKQPVDPTPDPTPDEVKSEIIIDNNLITNGLSFTSEKGEKSVSFTTNEEWTLSIASTPSGEAWCTASATSGAKGDATVKFSVTENTSYDDRSVSVTIKSGTASKTFTITQKYAEALLLTTNKYELSQEGGTVEIEVKVNIDYEMEIAESTKDWITEANTRALTTYKHTLTIAANEEVEKREGEIYFKSGDKVEIVKVYQSGAGPLILLSSNEYYASSVGETITIDIRSNCEYDIVMPTVDWIKNVPETKAMSSHTLKYEISPNETYENRDALIIFREIKGSISDTLHIIQGQKDAILLSQKEVEINFTGGTIEVKLESNTDYEIIMPENGWVTECNTRAFTTQTKTFSVSENNNADNRSCHIVFQSVNKSTADTLIINQKGKSDYLFFEEDIAYWDYHKGSRTIKIHSDLAYELIWTGGLPKWIDVWSTNDESVTIQPKENTSVKPRIANLVASSRRLSDTLLVVQDGIKGIELSQHSLEIDYIGDTITFTVDANIDYTMIVPEVDWIKVETIKQDQITIEGTDLAYNSKDIRLTIKALESSEDNRMEYITFDDNRTGYPQYDQALTIKQYKKFGNTYTMAELYRLDNVEELEELSIEGEMNRTDCNFLRRLAGGDIWFWGGNMTGYYTKTNTNPGKLKKLDLSKATIIACNDEPQLREPIRHQIANTLDLYHFSATKLETIILPDNLTELGNDAFENCTELKTIVLGRSLKTVCTGTFTGCKNLIQLIFPKGIKFKDIYSLGCFKNCSSLTDVTFLGDVHFDASANTSLFEDTQLTNLIINGNCDIIAPYTFDGCKYLKGDLAFKGVTSFGKQAFGYCENISKITFEDATFTSLEDYAFMYCRKLTSIGLPSSLQKIGKLVFAHCDALETISIPENVNYVDEYAFSNEYFGASNDSLKAINCYPTTPPTTKSTKYSEHTTLYVPKGCLEAYEKSQWGLNFKIIKEME